MATAALEQRPRPQEVLARVQRSIENPHVKAGMLAFAGTMAFLIFVGFVFPAPPSILFLGAITGSLNALIALGIVLVYRANRIINFATGDIGAFGGVLAVLLVQGGGWPFLLAVPVGLATAVAVGAVVEFLVIRRFSTSPRLILTVATIALSAVLAGFTLLLPRLFGDTLASQDFDLPFSVKINWFPVIYRSGHALILIVVPLLAAGLTAFFRFTRVGVAVRASAERADRAALLGIPVKRIGTLVWVLAAALSAIAVLLRAPVLGVPIGSVLGPSLLLRALAAAVIGKMENLSVTFAAAVVLGMLERATFWVTRRTLVSDAILFGIILASLLFQRRSKVSRAEDTGASTWDASREVRPIPRELKRLPLLSFGVPALNLAGLALIVLLPLRWNGSRVNIIGFGLILAIAVVSLVVLTGWAGQISLGQMAFVAFGSATAGRLYEIGWDFFFCLIGAGMVGAAVAVLIGLPALRIRGPFLAVATLGFSLATGSFFLNREFFPWIVPKGRISRPIIFGKFDLESEHTFYFLLVIVLLLVLGSARSFRNSRSGRVLVATRDNSRAAQSYGVSPVKAQLTAFALSGFIAAVAGAMLVFHQHGLTSTVLEAPQSIVLFTAGVIGGLASLPGALLGAAYLTFLYYSPLTKLPAVQLLASGFGVLIILLFLPAGLGGLFYDLRDNLLRRIARAKDILVPSLLADQRIEDADRPPDDALDLNLEGMEHDVELELLESR
ncbi:MAG TPA: ABC transporter permease [Acidimicrobiales bacterium]|nr:ABC transporter permease [Acidimicrobiales bacterium]